MEKSLVVDVLAELECLAAPADRGLKVAKDGVDPGKPGSDSRFALSDDDKRVRASCVDNAGKAIQAVAANIAAGRQVGLGPAGDGLAGEATNRGDFHSHRPACVVGGDRRDDVHFVERPAAGHARALANQLGVVELHVASQRLQRITLGHGGHQLVMHQPGGAVGCTQVLHESQRQQTGLVLADEVDGQEPSTQRQLGAVKHSTSGQRRLMAAALALEQPARAVAHDVVLCAIPARAAKPIRPAHHSERRSALVFAAVAGEELRRRHPRLELDSVHRHGWPPWF